MGEIGLFEAMSTCRAVRRLKPDPIPEDLLRKVLTAATWAPSGGNRQGGRFVVVRDPALRKQLRDLYEPIWKQYATPYRQSFEKLAEPQKTKALRMVASADYLAEHYDEPPAIVVVTIHMPDLAVTDAKLGRVPVVGGASIYPAVQNLMLAARGVGLGTTLTTLLCAVEPQVKALLGIPEAYATCAHVPIGFPQLKGFGPVDRRPVESVAYADRWENPLFKEGASR
jgi:nitroreductase